MSKLKSLRAPRHAIGLIKIVVPRPKTKSSSIPNLPKTQNIPQASLLGRGLVECLAWAT